MFDLDEEQQAVVSAGIEAILTGPAHALGEVVDWSRQGRLLDIGGGTGSWSIATVRRHSHLRATVLDLPVTADIARRRIAGTDVADRIAVHAADALTDPLPAEHDAFLVANVVHYSSPDTNRKLLRRIRDAAGPGGRLLLADFLTDPTHIRPIHAALIPPPQSSTESDSADFGRLRPAKVQVSTAVRDNWSWSDARSN